MNKRFILFLFLIVPILGASSIAVAHAPRAYLDVNDCRGVGVLMLDRLQDA